MSGQFFNKIISGEKNKTKSILLEKSKQLKAFFPHNHIYYSFSPVMSPIYGTVEL